MLKGYLEGYYGKLLSWNDRFMLLEKLSSLNMDFYIYGPKEDPYHRVKWTEPYPEQALNNFKDFHDTALKEGIRTYFSLSPGLSYGKNVKNDLRDLIAKIEQFLEIGYTDFAIFFDDIDAKKDIHLGHQHGEILTQVIKILDRNNDNSLIFCPTVYCNRFSEGELKDSVYLRSLSNTIPEEIPLLWTGKEVVSETISNEDIESLKSVIPNPVMIWDNYYANDYCPNSLFIGPFKGRSVTDKTILGLGINPTGLPITDSIILSQVKGLESTEKILKQYQVPDEFIHLLPFFSGPFDKVTSLENLKEIERTKEFSQALCIEWKSDLQLEWSPFLWNFFIDLNLLQNLKEGMNKKTLEAWASRRYSNPLLKTIFFDKKDRGE